MLRYYLLLLPVLLTACGQRGSGTTAATADSSFSEGDTLLTGNFYKRLAGTIAGKPVIVQLHCRDGSLQGSSYQYTPVGQVIGLRNGLDTVADDELILSEIVPGAQAVGATWTIRMHGRQVTGEWQRDNGAEHFPITLTEDYPSGCTRLKAFYVGDSAVLYPGKPASPKATTTYSYLLPAGEARGFLYDALSSQLAPGISSGDDVTTAVRAANATYFEEYRKEQTSLPQEADADLFAFNYTSDERVSVLYNDNYWLVTELFSSSYTGGAHGNYGSSYANIDLQQQRVWHITDFVSDTTALRPMLNDAAIQYFRLKPGEGMDQRMLVDEVPPTGNVYLSGTGLCFVYNPYEIASYADGQIALFLPYKKLMPFLTPAFKTRMHLTERAGMAMLSTQRKKYRSS